MKVLSIDVGIKNLALCLLCKSANNDTDMRWGILKWDVVDLTQKNDEAKCCEVDKFKICNKSAKFTKDGKYFCLKHSKKQQFKIPTSDLKPAFINKQKIQALYEMADKYNIKYEKPIKKQDLVFLLNEYVQNSCFEVVGNTNASKLNLVTIGKNIQSKLDSILEEHVTTINIVAIENQISPIANRMKTIQGMIAQYFIMRNPNIEIEFVSASNKLKEEKKDSKSTYTERKKLGIKKCLEIIQNDFIPEWTDVFNNHSKKDDLADSFLQGIWFIKEKIEKIEK
uniref:Mitochondrial resolvase Ydc2 catalytic domain-containing protein n=1 Tax=viral metagenome TaxID=1070528 RepID=A0A6C0KXV8_9ZZZZ